MFKERFIKICNDHNISPSKVCKEIGLSSAAFSCWTDESIPRRATLMKIADYFGITVDYLLGNTENREKAEEKTPSKLWEGEEMSDKEKQLWDLWHRVPDEQKPHILALIQSALALKAEEYKNGGQKG